MGVKIFSTIKNYSRRVRFVMYSTQHNPIFSRQLDYFRLFVFSEKLNKDIFNEFFDIFFVFDKFFDKFCDL